MRVVFMGRIAERAGPARSLDVPPGATVTDVTAALARGDEALGALLRAPSTLYVRDDEVVKADASLDGAQELAFLPPVSGG